MIRRYLKRHLPVVVFFIFLATGVLGLVALNVDAFNPFEKALQDFEITDLAQTEFKQDRYFESNIVLVNFGNISRGQLAVVLDSIAKYQPKVVGIDAFYSKPKDPMSDFALRMSMSKINNLVLVSKLDSFDTEKKRFEHLKVSAPIFSAVAHSGFANFYTGGEEGFRTTRKFSPKEKLKDTVEHIFAAEVVRHFDPKKYQKLLEREHELEMINFNGNVENYFRFDWREILNGTANLETLKDKIVLIGYIGDWLGDKDLVDIFYTPLNENIAGRSYPDMYGVVVHANIVSMILNETYIDQWPKFLDVIMAIFFAFLNGAIFLYWAEFKKTFFEIGVRLVQLIEMTILTAITIYLLSQHQIKLEATLAVIIIAASADFSDIYHSGIKVRVDRFIRRRQNKKASHKERLKKMASEIASET